MTRLCHLLLVLGALGTVSEQRLGDAVCRVEFDRDEIPLSGELTVTVSVVPYWFRPLALPRTVVWLEA